jgi:hypothetical protein
LYPRVTNTRCNRILLLQAQSPDQTELHMEPGPRYQPQPLRASDEKHTIHLPFFSVETERQDTSGNHNVA